MREVIRGGTYRDVSNGTLVRVIDASTDRKTNQTIISFTPQTGSDAQDVQQISETEFLKNFSLIV